MSNSEGSKSKAGTLLAAVSIIAVSVGMVSAQAESTNSDKGVLIGLSKQDKHSTQIKGDSNQHKDTSNQLKSEAIYMKHDSSQIKGESNQHKGESNQIKFYNGQSVQQKGNSLQQKGNAHGLNPQPEPPG